MIGSALAEFELSLTFANAPIDRFARGERDALTPQEKQGALLFFGRARCVACHAVGGRSNEMFSDFENHVLGVPQIAPHFGVGTGNVVFDGPGRTRTSAPSRSVAIPPTGTSSARRHSATSRSSRPSSTTARSPASRTRSATT